MAGEPTIMWRADDGDTAPVAVECPGPTAAYPSRDANGATIYVNTHFPTLEAAWAKLISSVRSQLFLAERDLQNAEAARRKAEQSMVKAGTRAALALEAHHNWREARERAGVDDKD